MSWQLPLIPLQPILLPLRSLDARSMLRAAEEAAEKTYSSVRLIILVSLVVLFFAMEAVHHHNDIAVISLALYGALTAVSLIVTWKRIFRPWMPYAFVTCDIGFIGLHLLEMARDLGFPPAAIFGIPASGLMFLVLTHAALRFRPALVIYAACVSLLFVVFSGSLLPAARNTQPADRSGIYASHLSDLVYWKVLPIAVIVLMSFMLWLISITMSRLLDQAIAHAGRSIRLSRFFSPNLVDRLSSDRQDLALMGRRCMAAILFIDIRGFTAMAEKMQPEDIVAMLSEFRSIVTDEVFFYDGTVDKFIGDSVMAVFGTPESRNDDGQRAVRCGLAILKTVRKWSIEREVRGNRSISIGIGAHYGEVFAGTIGNERLKEFTVLGDSVNVAARLEKVCSEIGGSFVISEALFLAAGSGLDPSVWQSLAAFHLPGRAQEITAFSLLATAYGGSEPQSLNENRVVRT